MGSILSFLFACIVIFVLSFVLGGIPFFVFAIMTSSNGSGDYMFAMALLIASIIEIIRFVSYISGKQINFEGVGIFAKIKSIFKKEKVNNQWQGNIQVKNKSMSLTTIEVIAVIACIVFAVFYKPHAIVLNVIYTNLIVRILYFAFFPVFISNIINQFRERFRWS